MKINTERLLLVFIVMLLFASCNGGAQWRDEEETLNEVVGDEFVIFFGNPSFDVAKGGECIVTASVGCVLSTSAHHRLYPDSTFDMSGDSTMLGISYQGADFIKVEKIDTAQFKVTASPMQDDISLKAYIYVYADKRAPSFFKVCVE